ncbi:MAG: hypothetical protein WAR83_09145 [Flavobacteriales bacterium]
MIISFIARILKLGTLALLIPVLYLVVQHRYVPAPRITPNIAVNEKLAFARTNLPEKLDVLAVGSSMTLNNLNTEAVLAHYGDIAYLNAGAWGTGASEVQLLGSILARKYQPKTVIVATNMMDFKKEENVLAEDSASIATYVNGASTWCSYLAHWDAPYYLRQSESNKLRFTDPANYEYLGFDACGGATLVVPAERIDQGRFNAGPPKSELMDEVRYNAFTDFAKDLRALNIDLVVLEGAYRDGLRTPENDQQHAAHVARLRAMLQPLGHTLTDANQRHWDDALYVDGSHLGQEGSKAFTAYCLGQLAR